MLKSIRSIDNANGYEKVSMSFLEEDREFIIEKHENGMSANALAKMIWYTMSRYEKKTYDMGGFIIRGLTIL